MSLYCNVCESAISSRLHNLSHKHKSRCCSEFEKNIQIVKTAFKNRLVSYRLFTDLHSTSVELYLEELKTKIIELIRKSLSVHAYIKLNMELFGLYILKETQEIKSFNSRYAKISSNTNLDKLFNEFKQVLVTKSGEFRERDSGWSLSKLLFLEVNINKFKPLFL